MSKNKNKKSIEIIEAGRMADEEMNFLLGGASNCPSIYFDCMLYTVTSCYLKHSCHNFEICRNNSPDQHCYCIGENHYVWRTSNPEKVQVQVQAQVFQIQKI
jgi:hypothetical protein